MASSPECITWMVVGLTESVTIIALNSLTVIAFCRDRNLRKRSTYLVISLPVTDMFTKGASTLDLFYNVGEICKFWRYNRALVSDTTGLTLLVSRLFVYKYDSYFSRTPECNVLAVQTSYGQKVSLLGSYHLHLVGSTALFMYMNVNNRLLLHR